MAKNQTAAPGEGAAMERKEGARERRFPTEALRGNCVKLFGCTSSTFDGAFFYADHKKEYTLAEAEEIIQKWLGRRILA